MGELSIWHWLIVLMVVLLLFGGGKVSGLMGDLAKEITRRSNRPWQTTNCPQCRRSSCRGQPHQG